jgi:hypothetical protein
MTNLVFKRKYFKFIGFNLKALDCIGEISQKINKDFLNQELKKIDQDSLTMLKEKKRLLNIYDSMVTYSLLKSEFLNQELESFCLKTFQTKSHFGFKCEMFRFLQRSEVNHILMAVTQKTDPKMVKILFEVVQNE